MLDTVMSWVWQGTPLQLLLQDSLSSSATQVLVNASVLLRLLQSKGSRFLRNTLSRLVTLSSFLLAVVHNTVLLPLGGGRMTFEGCRTFLCCPNAPWL